MTQIDDPAAGSLQGAARRPGFFARMRQGAHAPSRRTLYRWFLANHDQFEGLANDLKWPGWDAIAAELGEEGLTMKNGRPLTADYARQAWWKARKAVALARRRPAISGETAQVFDGKSSSFTRETDQNGRADVNDYNALDERGVNPRVNAKKLEARKKASKQGAGEVLIEPPDDDEFGPASLR